MTFWCRKEVKKITVSNYNSKISNSSFLLLLPLFVSAPYLLLYKSEISVLEVVSKKWELFVILPFLSAFVLLLMNSILVQIKKIQFHVVIKIITILASVLYVGSIVGAIIGGGIKTPLVLMAVIYLLIITSDLIRERSSFVIKNIAFGFVICIAFIVLMLIEPPGQRYPMPSISGASRISMPHNIHEYILARAREVNRTRKNAIYEIKDKNTAGKYQEECRNKISKIFGPLPPLCKLNPKLEGTIHNERNVIKKIAFESRPGFVVTGNLYMPKEVKRKNPALLFLCGHSYHGKSYEIYQKFCHYLSCNGMFVLIIDPIGQGERHQYYNKNIPMFASPTLEHIVVGETMLITEEFIWTWMAWDAFRAIEYLLSIPEVSEDAVAVMGNSGGGIQTVLTTALDCLYNKDNPKIGLSVISCSFGSYYNNICNEIFQDTEQLPLNIFNYNLEFEDMLVPHMPRDILIMAQQNDFFGITAVREGVERLKNISKYLGNGEESIYLIEGNNKHGLDKNLREAAYEFLVKWAKLKPTRKEKDWEDEAFLPYSDDELRVFSDGRVDLHGSKTVKDILDEKIIKIRERRNNNSNVPDLVEISRSLRINRTINGGPSKVLKGEGEFPILRASEPIQIEDEPIRFLNWYPIETEEGILCNLFVVSSRKRRTLLKNQKEILLYLPDRSVDKEIYSVLIEQEENNILSDILRGKTEIYIFEARSLGRSAPCLGGFQTISKVESELFISSSFDALGEPLLGRRIFDVLQLIELLREKYGCSRIKLIGKGMGAVIATYTTALESTGIIREIELENPPESYEKIAQGEPELILHWSRSCFFPGALKLTNFNDLIVSIRRRGVDVNIVKTKEAKKKWVDYLKKYGNLPKAGQVD